MSFRTDREPWIPAVGEAGPVEVSLRDALLHAHELRGLDVAAGALDIAALYGLLVAIVMDAHDVDTEQDWLEFFARGRFDSQVVDAYFNDDPTAWDLFDPERPFLQVGGLEPLAGGPKSVSLLIPEVATGNNVPLFSSSTEANPPPLTFADAARRLVSAHAFDTAAIKTGAKGDPRASAGKTTGNPTGPLGQLGVILPCGRTLFETLMLGVRFGPRAPGDAPAWRRAAAHPFDASWQDREPLGLLDLLTWQSRRIRLFPGETPEGPRVTGVLVAAGDRFLTVPRLEPRCAWRATRQAGAPEYRPIRHQAGRSGWRGMASLIAVETSGGGQVRTSDLLAQIGRIRGSVAALTSDHFPLGEDYPLDVLLVGVNYGNMSAVVESVVVDTVPLPVLALAAAQGGTLRDILREVVEEAEEVRAALDGLHANLRASTGGEKVPWDKGTHPGEVFVSQLDPAVLRLLTGLQREPGRADDALTAWENTLRELAVDIAAPMIGQTYATTLLGTQHGDDSVGMSPARAERIFRGTLRKALPHLVAEPASISEESDDL